MSFQTALQKVDTNEPSCWRVNLPNNASFSLNSTTSCKQLGTALENNTYLKELRLEGCGIVDAGVEHLAEALKKNTTLTILDLSKNKIGSAGLTSLADALKVNNTLTELVLMNQSQKFGEAALTSVIDMFEFNTTLLNINWRLDSRQSFKINSCLTRNKEILRRQKSGLSIDDIDPAKRRDGEPPRVIAPVAATSVPESVSQVESSLTSSSPGLTKEEEVNRLQKLERFKIEQEEKRKREEEERQANMEKNRGRSGTNPFKAAEEEKKRKEEERNRMMQSRINVSSGSLLTSSKTETREEEEVGETANDD